MVQIRKSSLASVLLAAGCACACQQPATPTAAAKPAQALTNAAQGRVADNTVVATWDGGKMTYGELMAKRASQFKKLRNKQAQEQYQAEQAELGQMIAEDLVTKAATAKGLTPEVFMQQQMGDLSVSETEINDFYAKNTAQIGAPLEVIRPQLRTHLEQQKVGQAQNRVIGDLMKASNVKFDVPAPATEKAELAIAGRPTKGKPDAKVTVAVFSDFQCPFCSRAAPSAESLVAAFPNDVKVVFFNFPLNFHPMAMPSAIAASCAAEQGKFWEYHDTLFKRQSELSPELMDTVGKDLGLDLAKFAACRANPATQKKVQDDMSQGEAAGVEGTPSFFINGSHYPNGVPTVEALKPYVQG
ncbi:MAG: thioredoxin domain-containing protein [Deltaproteobacteria bacterium]|nr:thioredoxin domain-containing protein [Deltaproteobacteria bacterium]